MKKIFLFAIIFAVGTVAQAQQIFQSTHYMLNPLPYNPAISGNSEQVITKFSFRKQWTGLEGSPATAVLSAHGNLSEKKAIGLGGIFYSDNTGPTKRLGLQLSYAYHIPLVEDKTYLGIGLSANIMQQKINFDELIAHDLVDNQLLDGTKAKFGADANLGLYLHSLNYWVGLSANQLFASKFKFEGSQETLNNARHFYLGGGYAFDVTDKITIDPSLLLKIVSGDKPQLEIGTKVVYDKQYWLGLSYRTEDALAILLGVQLNNGFNIAYSYDITTSDLNKVSNGSHEVTLGYNFTLNKKTTEEVPAASPRYGR